MKNTSLSQRFLLLGIKFLFVTTIILASFTFVFGLIRCQSVGMKPEIVPGDLGVYFRLSIKLQRGDLAVARYRLEGQEEKEDIFRVLGLPGDTIDLREGKLYVNGLIQVEEYAQGKTLRYQSELAFPLTLEKDTYFLLSDQREQATDSRVFGSVIRDKIAGKILFLLKKY